MHKKKIFLTILSFSIFLIYFTFLSFLIPFIFSVPLKNGSFKTLSSQSDLYKMIDTFYDPDDFHNFRNSAENINILSNFYNQLNASKNFDVLTSFNQAIPVTNFRGDNSFYYNSETFIEKNFSTNINVKALQLNQKAFSFYNIVVDTGQDIPWNNILYNDTKIPILLGSDYRNYYHLGDTIHGNYYSKNMDFKVIGFLKDNCSIKYKNITDVNLDTYMVIPYPTKLWKCGSDFQFESLLYFAMINCDLVPFVNENQLFKEIEEISTQTGFNYFSLVGTDNFQTQNMEFLFFIQKHRIFFALSILIIFICINRISIKFFCYILHSKNITFTKNQKNYHSLRCFIFYYNSIWNCAHHRSDFFNNIF